MSHHIFPTGSLRRLVAGNTIYQLIGKAISAGCMTIMSVFLAQRFGSFGYGDFIKITTYVGFFYLLGDYGLNAIYLQRAANNNTSSDAKTLWKNLLGVRVLIALMLMTGAFLGVLLLPTSYGQGYTPLVRAGIYILIPTIIFQSVITTTNAFFQQTLRYELSAFAQSVGSIVMVTLLFFLARYSSLHGPILGVLSLVAGSITVMGISLLYIAERVGNISPKIDGKTFMSLFIQATPLGLALLCNLIYFHVDSVILAITRSTAEVGIYGLAYKVFELPLVLPIFFMNAVYPLLLKTDGTHTRSKRRIFFVSLLCLGVASLCISIALWYLAPIATYIRPEFVQSIAPLRVLTLGLPVFFVSALCMWFLVAERQHNTLLGIYSIAMIANIVANIIFVPIYGYMASAWITVIGESGILLASGITLLQRDI